MFFPTTSFVVFVFLLFYSHLNILYHFQTTAICNMIQTKLWTRFFMDKTLTYMHWKRNVIRLSSLSVCVCICITRWYLYDIERLHLTNVWVFGSMAVIILFIFFVQYYLFTYHAIWTTLSWSFIFECSKYLSMKTQYWPEPTEWRQLIPNKNMNKNTF